MKNLSDLKKFIVIAKRSTYDKSGESGERRLADGSKGFIFSRGDYAYRDRYFGFNPFIGQEVVFYKGKPVWGMNYSGRVTASRIYSLRVYNFLKKTL